MNTHPAGRLDGETAIIFGGTSGIGLATAVQAKALGAEVTVIGTDPDRARRAAQDHGLAGWRAADVTRIETVAEALSDFTRVDHLVMLAGTFVVGKILEAEVSFLRQAFDERIWGSVHAIRALSSRLAADGSITLISGQLAERPTGTGTAIVSAAAVAMEALARGLALELAPRRVNAVSPGWTETPLLTKALGDDRDQVVDGVKKAALLKRLGTAEEAAAAVIFLMTNGYMNGATLNIDGGGRLI